MSLLPPQATPLERALEKVIERISAVPVPVRTLWNADTCPAYLLPWLAWALSIDAWSSDWPEAVRRERVRQALAIQRRKGTAQSVRAVVDSFGGQVALREWWQMDPPGPAHSFEMLLVLNDLTGAPATAAYVDAVVKEVARTKPVRSHFTFTQGLSARLPIGMKLVARPVTFARLNCVAPAA